MARAVLAGHPQTVLYLSYVGAAYFLFRMPWRSWWQALWPVAAACGLGAIQLLPSLQLLAFNHKGKLDFNFAAGGLNPGDLAALFTHNPSGGRILYVGLVPLALAALAALAVRRRQILFWLLMAALALLLSLGIHSPVFRFFFDYLPGWNLFRDQERSVVIFVMALSVLAGYGLAWLLAAARRRARPKSAVLAAVAGSVLVLASYANLVLVNQTNNLWSGDPERDFKLGALLAPLRADRDIFRVRVSEDSISHNAGNVLGLQVVSGNSPFELQSFKDWTEDATHPRVTEWQLMQLTNTHYIVSSRELCGGRCQPSDGIRQIGVDGKLRLFEILYPQPRAFFVTHAVGVAGQRQAIDGINRQGFAPQQTIFIQGTPSHSSPYDAGAKLRADVVGYSPGLVELGTSSDRPAYLFTSEVAYPGWRASIDGRPAPILVADGLFRALDVPPGLHHVAFQYVPVPFFAGAAISAATLLIMILALVWAARPRPKGKHATSPFACHSERRAKHPSKRLRIHHATPRTNMQLRPCRFAVRGLKLLAALLFALLAGCGAAA
ncbi:MAG: YfhO family protein, partial [Chloroflexota bacterium]|nr:YfhO family protein [Chloroflexota bacterium]